MNEKAKVFDVIIEVYDNGEVCELASTFFISYIRKV